MILFQSLKNNFNLTDKGFYYFRVTECVLDIPSLITTIFAFRKNNVNTVNDLFICSNFILLTHKCVRGCSWCQIKVFS